MVLAMVTSEIFGNSEFAKAFIDKRTNPGNFNDFIEMPCVLALLPPNPDLVCMELGCGPGFLTAQLANRYKKVVGVDRSEVLLSYANSHIHRDNVTFLHKDLDRIEEFPRVPCDILVSSLLCHFLKNWHAVVRAAYETLNCNGIFVYSSRHPIRTSHTEGFDPSTLSWNVTNYTPCREVSHNWMGNVITTFHRTVSEHTNIILNAGFQVKAIIEPVPKEQDCISFPSLREATEVPAFIVFSASK